MKRNYSELIKSKSKRQLTAKGYKFLWQCIDVVADQNGVSRYSSEIKHLKEKLSEILDHLIIDREMSVDQIKELIKNRKVNNSGILVES